MVARSVDSIRTDEVFGVGDLLPIHLKMPRGEKMKRINPYLVVGTGRSGTSTVARVLHENLGIYMGEESRPPDKFNPKGYFEDVDFRRVNIDFYKGKLNFEQWCLKVRDIIHQRYKLQKPWGFKESRMAALLGFYLTFFDKPRIIRCKRKPELVINSLMRCYGWSRKHAEQITFSRETQLDRLLSERDQRDILTIRFDEQHVDESLIERMVTGKWRTPIKLYVAVLNKGWLRREFIQRVLPVMRSTHGVEVVVENFSLTWANPICSNRAKIMMRFLTFKPKQDYLLELDDDCVPYFNPARFVFADKDVIGFPAPVRSNGQQICFTAYTKHAELDGYVAVDLARIDQKLDLVQVDTIGTGCILIKRKVLEKLKHKKPFAVPFDKYGQSKFGTDFAFSRKAKDAGFQVFSAPHHYVEHFKEVPLLDIDAFDSPIKRDFSSGKYKMPWGEWSITQRDWEFIKGVIEKEFGDKKLKILEFGSGLSSLLMSEKHDVTTYEVEKEFAEKIKEKATFRNTIQVRMWDGREIKEKLGKFDLVFVDGPLGKSSGGIGREHSLKIASEVSDRVIIHDADREDERLWQKLFFRNKFRLADRSGLHQTRCNFWKTRCTACGRCCILANSPGRYILLTEKEAKSGKYKTRNHPDLKAPRALARKKVYSKELKRQVWACYHLNMKKMKCSIYKDRPFDCQRYDCHIHGFAEKWEAMVAKYKKRGKL